MNAKQQNTLWIVWFENGIANMAKVNNANQVQTKKHKNIFQSEQHAREFIDLMWDYTKGSFFV